MRETTPTELRNRLSGVRLVIFDVDGVLTSGKKLYTADGLYALEFDARDGLGIHLLQLASVKLACITNGKSAVVSRRAADLGIRLIKDGVSEKGTAVRELIAAAGVSVEETVYVGDDLWDLPAFDEVGTSIAVPDGVQEARDAADWVTERPGGAGAVREIAEAILEAQDRDSLELLGLRVHSPHHVDDEDRHAARGALARVQKATE
jgi:3-deoxy-D-manno-octulosonate 8-phosphate phosphatase (KDO 8-P phosphatase)